MAVPDDDCVIVVAPDGGVAERIELGSDLVPTNLCFGGAELRTLFVTAAAGGRVVRIERATPGLPVLPAGVDAT